MTTYLIVPGLGNSGPGHWQTCFEQVGPQFKRVEQQEWDAPVCQDWVDTLDQAVSALEARSVVLIAHSLGCATIAHWAAQSRKPIKGALLVAPSDLEAPQYTFPAQGFSPVPTAQIHFPTIVVASTNDPWVSLDRARYFADCWGSEFIDIGAAGHINVASGFGEWKQGLDLLQQFG